MTLFRSHRRAIGASAIAVTLASCLWAAPASAQQFRDPFSFNSRNPASMAVFMRQRGDRNDAVGSGGDTVQIGETLVCAGTGTTSATSAGNIMCVLAGDGTNVIVDSDQNSNGDQTADADTTTAGDEIQDILDGEDDQ
jgi:hypothetical protein